MGGLKNKVKRNDATRKVKTATAKDKINKNNVVAQRKKENARLFKGKIIPIDNEEELKEAAEKISRKYINASMKAGKSLPELGPIKAKEIFEQAFLETGYSYYKTLHTFAEELSNDPMKLFEVMDNQNFTKILMAFTLPYEEAKDQNVSVNQIYTDKELEDIKKIKNVFGGNK